MGTCEKHEPSGIIVLASPPQFKCKKCGEKYTPEVNETTLSDMSKS